MNALVHMEIDILIEKFVMLISEIGKFQDRSRSSTHNFLKDISQTFKEYVLITETYVPRQAIYSGTNEKREYILSVDKM